jgi:hypothetical protein
MTADAYAMRVSCLYVGDRIMIHLLQREDNSILGLFEGPDNLSETATAFKAQGGRGEKAFIKFLENSGHVRLQHRPGDVEIFDNMFKRKK